MFHPHDKLFHFTFHHPVHAASWLAAVLPAELVQDIDWQTLTPLGERLPGLELRPHAPDGALVAQRRSDRRATVFVGEHKRGRDAQVGRQVLRYAVLLQHELQLREGKWPLLVTLVVQHGAGTPVTGEPAADDDDPFTPWQPSLRVVVDELRAAHEQRIRDSGTTALVTLTRLCLAVLPECDPEGTVAALRRWADLLRHVDRATAATDAPPWGETVIDAIGWYALAVTDVTPQVLTQTLAEILDRQETTIMSTLERTYQNGKAAGMAEGKAEGKAEGETFGRAQTLLLMLEQRFGTLDPSVAQRLFGASREQLTRWTGRVLVAASPDEVLAD